MRRSNLIFYILIGLLPFSLTACGKNETAVQQSLPPLIKVGTVEYANNTSRSFTGVIAARVQSDQGFRVSGKIVERLVDTGQTVKRGQLLMRIDPIDLALAARAQEESVVAARVRARQTAADEARYRGLVATGAISASAYAQLKSAAESAQADLKAAEANANVAKNATSYALLRADSDGVVVETLAEPGQVVSAGQVVVRVAHAGQREALIQLPETLRPAIGSVGQTTLYGSNNVTEPAKLRLLSNAADRFTRTFEARYVLTGTLANAPLGATVTIQIPNVHSETQDYLQVPLGALFDPGTGPGVWLIAENSAHVSWSPVTVISLSDERVVIKGTLKPGDRVAALGAHLLKDGQSVRVLGSGANNSAVSDKGISQ